MLELIFAKKGVTLGEENSWRNLDEKVRKSVSKDMMRRSKKWPRFTTGDTGWTLFFRNARKSLPPPPDLPLFIPSVPTPPILSQYARSCASEPTNTFFTKNFQSGSNLLHAYVISFYLSDSMYIINTKITSSDICWLNPEKIC